MTAQEFLTKLMKIQADPGKTAFVAIVPVANRLVQMVEPGMLQASIEDLIAQELRPQIASWIEEQCA